MGVPNKVGLLYYQVSYSSYGFRADIKRADIKHIKQVTNVNVFL